MGCYIWYSEEGPGRAGAPSSPLLAVPNVTAHPSTASVPTSYYSMCTIIPSAHQRVPHYHRAGYGPATPYILAPRHLAGLKDYTTAKMSHLCGA